MKKARITPVALATALVAIWQTTPAAAEVKTQAVDYKFGFLSEISGNRRLATTPRGAC